MQEIYTDEITLTRENIKLKLNLLKKNNWENIPTEDGVFEPSKLQQEIFALESDGSEFQALLDRLKAAYTNVSPHEFKVGNLNNYGFIIRILLEESKEISDGMSDMFNLDINTFKNNIDIIIDALTTYSTEHERQHINQAEKLGWNYYCLLRVFKSKSGKIIIGPFIRLLPPMDISLKRMKRDSHIIAKGPGDSMSKGDKAFISNSR